MTIGILTYHRSQNYGAQIQAFALQEYLKSIGCRVSIIDYWPEYHKKLYRPRFIKKQELKRRSAVSKVKYIFQGCLLHFFSFFRQLHTQRFVQRYLNISSSTSYDMVIYGSDQIWRKQHLYPCESYNPIYFGDNQIQAHQRIAYAASMGRIEVTDSSDLSFLHTSLSKFNAISVREKDLLLFIRNELALKAELVCDPVLLLSKEQWEQVTHLSHNPSRPYIFKYNLVGVQEIDVIAEKLSVEYQLPIVEFSGYVSKVSFKSHRHVMDGADSFLKYLAGASYVVTSSFHGVALALCFEKQFWFASIPELSNRTESLLEQLGLKNRIIESSEDDKDYSSIINYSQIQDIVKRIRENSRIWLNGQISSGNNHEQC